MLFARRSRPSKHGAHASPIAAIAFSDDSGNLPTAGTQGTIKIWQNVEQLNSESEPLVTLKGHSCANAAKSDGQVYRRIFTWGTSESLRIPGSLKSPAFTGERQ